MKIIALDEAIVRKFSGEEKVFWYGTPNAKGYVLDALLRILPVALLLVFFDAALLVTLIITKVFSTASYLAFVILPFFIIHFAPVWIWFSGIFKIASAYKSVQYVLTDKRLYIKQKDDIRIVETSEIKSVESRNSFVLKPLRRAT